MPPKPKEFAVFERLTDRLLSVPREVVERRIAAHKEQAALNPKKRGPKPKRSGERLSD
jgi:hypothetical protein